MCGLVGMVTNRLTNPEIKRLQFMAGISALRGDQSTGTIWVDKDLNWRSHKRVGHPFDVTRSRQWLDMMNDVSVRACLIHTRYATKGAINVENAHPFVTETIIGMHNGTINYGIPEKYKQDVDSHGLYEFITAEGLVKALSSVKYGAYALQWIQFHGEEKELKLHIIRNEERTLHYADTHGCRIWMSDKTHLQFCMDTTNTKGKIETFEPYHLYTMTLDGVGNPKWEVEDLTKEIGKPKVGQRGTYFRYPYYEGWWGEDERENTATQHNGSIENGNPVFGQGVLRSPFAEAPKQEQEKTSPKAISEIAWINPYGSHFISKKVYRGLKSSHCCICGESSSKDYEESFITEHDWMCPLCVEQVGPLYAEGLLKFQRNRVQPQGYRPNQFECRES